MKKLFNVVKLPSLHYSDNIKVLLPWTLYFFPFSIKDKIG